LSSAGKVKAATGLTGEVRRLWNSVGVRVEGRETVSGGEKLWCLYWAMVVMMCGLSNYERIELMLLEIC
jgi:hypothetical protein